MRASRSTHVRLELDPPSQVVQKFEDRSNAGNQQMMASPLKTSTPFTFTRSLPSFCPSVGNSDPT